MREGWKDGKKQKASLRSQYGTIKPMLRWRERDAFCFEMLLDQSPDKSCGERRTFEPVQVQGTDKGRMMRMALEW